MKTWQHPVRPLPRTVRPVLGETTVSYVVRLATENHLTPMTLFRYLGQGLYAPPAHQHVLGCNVLLNPAATRRLAAAAQRPVGDLQRALPDLTFAHEQHLALPTDRPAVRWRNRYHQTTACVTCMSRRGIRVPVLTYRPAPLDRICLRHGIWLDGPQIDVNPLPEVLAAFRGYRRFCRRHGTDQPVMHAAETIVRDWYQRQTHPALTARWDNRWHAINVERHHTASGISTLITLPEIVAITGHLLIRRPTRQRSDYDFLKTLTQKIGLRGPWEFQALDPLKLWLHQQPTSPRPRTIS